MQTWRDLSHVLLITHACNRHGMIQMHNNVFDGVAGLTQKPVQPGGSQIYTFTADSHGTYWYHSHFKAQYIDGLKVS